MTGMDSTGSPLSARQLFNKALDLLRLISRVLSPAISAFFFAADHFLVYASQASVLNLRLNQHNRFSDRKEEYKYAKAYLEKMGQQTLSLSNGWMTGIEPAAAWTTTRCSTTELHPPCLHKSRL